MHDKLVLPPAFEAAQEADTLSPEVVIGTLGDLSLSETMIPQGDQTGQSDKPASVGHHAAPGFLEDQTIVF